MAMGMYRGDDILGYFVIVVLGLGLGLGKLVEYK